MAKKLDNQPSDQNPSLSPFVSMIDNIPPGLIGAAGPEDKADRALPGNRDRGGQELSSRIEREDRIGWEWRRRHSAIEWERRRWRIG